MSLPLPVFSFALVSWARAHYIPPPERNTSCSAPQVKPSSELFTPPFRAVLFKCVGFTIGLLVLLIVGIEWTFSHFVQWPDWIETAIQWLGGFALVVGSIFLIPPVTSLIAGLYLDDIAALVERDELSRPIRPAASCRQCRPSAWR